MIITHPYQIERHSLGGRNAFPTIPINPKPGHIPYHKGLGFIGILEWDSDDRFCHFNDLLETLPNHQVWRRYACTYAPFCVWAALQFCSFTFSDSKELYSFGFLKIFKEVKQVVAQARAVLG